MIVPFIFNISAFQEAAYLWFFYKYLTLAKKHGWPMIAQEIYFTKKPSQFAAEGRSEALSKSFADKVYYQLPKNSDLRKVRQYPISDSLWERLADEMGSVTDAFCYLIRDTYPPLEKWIGESFKDITRNYDENIEAVVTLGHCPSLAAAAEKLGIPVICIEWGVFRQPVYLDTAFFTLDNLNSRESVPRRWERFLAEHETRSIPIFTGAEMLTIFLRNENLKELEKLSTQPTYKIGAALGYAIWELLQYDTRYSDAEMLYDIKKAFGAENMTVRRHPGDPHGAQYPLYANRLDSPKYSTIDFILACNSVASLGSNVSTEAMYWGRKSNVLRPSAHWYAAAHTVKNEGNLATNLFLTFYAFCYMIPFELLTNMEYIHWRLTMPTERDIYFRHVEFFFNKKAIPTNLIFEPEGTRFDRMLGAQK